jgi:hypothetical protein
MIESPKLMPTFVWNSHGFEVADVMPKGEMVPAVVSLRMSEIMSVRSLLGVEREVKGGWSCTRTMQGHIQ